MNKSGSSINTFNGKSAQMKKVVIVDDFEDSCLLLSEVLSPYFDCTFTSDANSAVKLISEIKPDVILLDYKMPGIMGIDLCQIVRQNESLKKTPIIFVSGSATIDEKIKAFEMGADDFVSKPFNVKELVLRIKARISKTEKAISELSAGNLKMNLLSRQVFIDNEEVNLTPKQFDLLKMLLEYRNNLVTREKCLGEIWSNSEVTARNVDSQINYLKRKLIKFSGRIVAVPSLGYRLEAQEFC